MKDSRYWSIRLLYKSKMTGKEVEAKYNELACGDNTDMTATQIFPVGVNPTKIEEKKWNVFFYYKDKNADVKGI